MAIRWIYNNIRRLTSRPLHFFVDIVAALSVVYAVFLLLWGLNYYRVPLHQTLDLDIDYTTEELISTTQKLIEKSNRIPLLLGV
jgi:hypothetical protein